MKPAAYPAALGLILGLHFSALAQDHGAAERARIDAQRSRAEADYARESAACYQNFVVNDCLADVRARRRTLLADLKRQDNLLNDADRKRRAADQVRRQEERSSMVREEEAAAQRQRAVSDQLLRDQRAADKAVTRAEMQSGEGDRARQFNDKQRVRVQKEAARAEQEAAAPGERERFERKQREAETARLANEKKLADQQSGTQKSRAKPLPAP